MTIKKRNSVKAREKSIILRDVDGGRDHLIVQSIGKTTIINLINGGVKGEIYLGIPELQFLHEFTSKHLKAWK